MTRRPDTCLGTLTHVSSRPRPRPRPWPNPILQAHPLLSGPSFPGPQIDPVLPPPSVWSHPVITQPSPSLGPRSGLPGLGRPARLVPRACARPSPSPPSRDLPLPGLWPHLPPLGPPTSSLAPPLHASRAGARGPPVPTPRPPRGTPRPRPGPAHHGPAPSAAPPPAASTFDVLPGEVARVRHRMPAGLRVRGSCGRRGGQRGDGEPAAHGAERGRRRGAARLHKWPPPGREEQPIPPPAAPRPPRRAAQGPSARCTEPACLRPLCSQALCPQFYPSAREAHPAKSHPSGGA